MKQMITRALLLVLLFPIKSFAAPYCIALRGNGELVPSHWGALSHTVETFGLPSALAGGSSASISIFLVDSILQNSILKSEEDQKKKTVYLAFLIKSIEGYMQSRLSHPDLKALIDFAMPLTDKKSAIEKLEHALLDLSQDKVENILQALEEVKATKVFYGQSVEKLHKHVLTMDKDSINDWKKFENLVRETHLSISLIGKFDAKNDANLLIRDGVINFSALAELYSHVGEFYSMHGATTTTRSKFKELLNTCAYDSIGKTWQQQVEAKPECQIQLDAVITNYFETAKYKESILDKPMGRGIDAIVTGGLVRGESLKILQNAKKDLEQTFSATAGNIILDEKDISFGYMGSKDRLLKIEQVFTNQDSEISKIDKSTRFLSLGVATWRDGLALSGNEPGLSAYTEGIYNNELMGAIGGWSDLHPTLVLKVSGCDSVVYVTRRGGDTIFGQGLAKRVFNFDNIPWDDLDPYEPNLTKNQKLNNNGREDNKSLWAKMYNLAYDKSSYAYSLAQADAVVCTDWNAFDVTKEIKQLIEDSYTAPIYNPSGLEMSGLVPVHILTEADNIIDAELGYYKYSGCIPLEKSPGFMN